VAAVLVVLDTNALFDDPGFDRPAVGKLFALARRKLVDVAVPRVVLLELERQRRTAIQNKLDQLKAVPKKIEGALHSLGVSSEEAGIAVPDPPAVSFDALLERYNERVTEALAANNIDILPVPDVTHEELLARDLASKKPFDLNGKGYRDALIWESVLRCYRQLDYEDHLFFVTDDSNFGDGEGLDAGLFAELPEEVAVGFTRVRSLDELLEDETMQEQRLVVQQALDSTDRPSVFDLVEGSVEHFVENQLPGQSLGAHTHDALDLPPEVEDLEVDEGTTIGNFAWSLYDEFDGTTVLGEAAMDVELTLRGFVTKANAAVLADERLAVEGWEEDVATVLLTVEARALFDARVEVMGESVEDITFLGLEAA
jgi:hypothetical protein